MRTDVEFLLQIYTELVDINVYHMKCGQMLHEASRGHKQTWRRVRETQNETEGMIMSASGLGTKSTQRELFSRPIRINVKCLIQICVTVLF